MINKSFDSHAYFVLNEEAYVPPIHKTAHIKKVICKLFIKNGYKSGTITLFPTCKERAIIAIPILKACPVKRIVPIVAEA